MPDSSGPARCDVTDASVAAYVPAAYATKNADKVADLAARMTSLAAPAGLILDAGCGPGRDMRRFTDAGLTVVGVDLNAGMLALASGRRVRADLRALPFPGETFAAVWASASLVHLPKPQAVIALTELARVARPDAPLYVSVKSTQQPRGWRARDLGGPRWFETWTAGSLAAALWSTGWQGGSVSVDGDFVNAWATRSPR